ncbi:hypothetical protein [Nocardia arthritidis]|uniref:Uncharacterized protein n=1 Tax=Nocardia arthritidis TaxID=228602 RepID=A0A6G9YQN2_9NOCA|nr:hypothetical protein [Nocardia arthritidis]QIS15609.1 hypothetical protein F5544_38940 [Nocardia arthritidis]
MNDRPLDSQVGTCRFPIAYDTASGAFWVCGHTLPNLTRDVSDYCEEICLDPDARLRRHDGVAASRREWELRVGTAGPNPAPSSGRTVGNWRPNNDYLDLDGSA